MISIRRIVTQWGRRMVGGLIVALLFSQMALAMYACPRLDSDAHVASMQMAGIAMGDSADMASMPDCHSMPGTMDGEAPQLCRAHCGDGSQPAPTLQGLSIESISAQAVWITYVLPAIADVQPAQRPGATLAQPGSRADTLPIYLTLQVLRN